MIDVKQAVSVVRSFLEDLYGARTAETAQLEEVEIDDDAAEWVVTMNLDPSLSVMMGSRSQKDLKVFRVGANSGEVRSMKIKPS